MSRWKYRTDTVSVGDNRQDVRQLTAGERKEFVELSREIKEGKKPQMDLPPFIIKAGAINPACSDDDVASMPTELADACVRKIMELTGLRYGAADDADSPEKKELNS